MISFTPFPAGGVVSDDPKGAYFNRTPAGLYQIIVVGRMQGTPGQYADAFALRMNEAMDIVDLRFLHPPASPALAEQVRRRGFVSIGLKVRERHEQGLGQPAAEHVAVGASNERGPQPHDRRRRQARPDQV